jgi:peroxiredoxin
MARPRRKAVHSRPLVRSRRWAVAIATVATAVIVIGAVAAAFVVGSDDGSQTQRPSSARVGQVAPSTEFAIFKGGQASLADYRGKPLVVNFFASWCTPCLRELPGFEQLHQRLTDRVAFVGLNLQDTVDDGQQVIRQTGITYDTGRDPDGELYRAFGAFAMPATVLIDRAGRVVEVHNGELTAEQLEAKINPLIVPS